METTIFNILYLFLLKKTKNKKNRTFQRVKYTENFGFPLILDMEPYLQENLGEQISRTAEDDKLIEQENKEAEAKRKRIEAAKKKVML